MTDENIDLQFLAEQGKRILDELAEARSEQERLAGRVAVIVEKVADAVTAVATTQERHSEILESMHERLQIAEGRLNRGDLKVCAPNNANSDKKRT